MSRTRRGLITGQRTRRGLITVQEMIVVCPLLLMLLTLVYMQLVNSSRSAVQLTTQAQLQEAATMVQARIESDLALTPAGGVGIKNAETDDDIAILTLNRVRALDATGLANYEPKVSVFVHDPSRQMLLLREWTSPITSMGITFEPLEAYRPTASDMLRLARDVNPTERIIAVDVKRFEVTSAAPEGTVGNPLTVTLKMAKHVVAGEGDEEVDLSRTYTLRN